MALFLDIRQEYRQKSAAQSAPTQHFSDALLNVSNCANQTLNISVLKNVRQSLWLSDVFCMRRFPIYQIRAPPPPRKSEISLTFKLSEVAKCAIILKKLFGTFFLKAKVRLPFTLYHWFQRATERG